ncbi:hypothetical protein HGA89_05785, partial [bacterium]|nr:hypothetical protein [bacterium]
GRCLLAPQERGDEPPLGPILIAGHAPAAADRLAAARYWSLDALADRGLCVVAGHPGLAVQAQGLLPSGWTVRVGAGLAPADLAPLFTGARGGPGVAAD